MFELKYLIPIIVFLGYFAGWLIKKHTTDEFEAGKKWFVLMQKILIVVLAIGCLYYTKLSLWLIVGAVVGFFTVSTVGIYLYFGIISFLSLIFTDYMIVMNSLMFLFGLPYGTMGTIKTDWKVFLFFVPLLIFLIPIDYNLFFGICCGALIRQYYLVK